MEVASPLAFQPSQAGTKRSLACSPQIVKGGLGGLGDSMEMADENLLRSAKRRRFHGDMSMDALSESFSSHSPFFSTSKHPNKSPFPNQSGASLKRLRADSPAHEDLKRVVDEQAAMIDSLKSEKCKVESSLNSLKIDHERISKENHILRRAVTIQQERHTLAENECKAAHQGRLEAEDRAKKLEQVVLSLRYHLQAQQSNTNDFMHMRPPDVY